MASPTVQLVDCRDAPIERVTVFTDRAEIKRTATLKLQPGVTEVNIRNIPGDVLDDSVRVSGSGAASIHEVQVAYKSVTEEEKLCPQALELRDQVQEVEKKVAVLQNRAKIVQKQTEALNNLLNKIGNTGDAKSLSFSDSSFESIGKLFGFYEEKVLELQQTEGDLGTEERKVREKLDGLRQDLNRYINPGAVKTVTVVLETESESGVDLLLSYHVHNAYWRPTYDVRVEKESGQMLITYNGCVTQHSGEEWQNCQLVLSTAKPAAGGDVPELGTLDVSFWRKPDVVAYNNAMPYAMACAVQAETCRMDAAPMMMKAMNVVTASVDEQALSTEFLIQRPASIPPDGAEHKVTIGVAALSALLQHECVPSKSTAVYLTASARNTSDLPFLAGDAAVFLDGNFISKSFLKAVSPEEIFTVSLGVDAAIRVDYRPAHDVKGQAGIISKSANTVREQNITLKNTRKDAVLVTVREHVPRSTDEKIKVRLLTPEASSSGASEEGVARCEGALLNPTNNLEWTVLVDANDKKALSVKWHVDYPGEEKLEFREKF